jgi:hypothetical protein
MCVLRLVDPPHSGVMMGCLRRPKRPSTLYCVLAAVVLSVAVSISPSDALQWRPTLSLISNQPVLVSDWREHTPGHRQFADNLPSAFNEFQKSPRHPTWQEVTLAPDWRSFHAVEASDARAKRATHSGIRQEAMNHVEGV